jgi:hypothetical protein
MSVIAGNMNRSDEGREMLIRDMDRRIARLESEKAGLLAACERAIEAYDAAYARGKAARWKGEDVDAMRAAIAAAKSTNP